MLKVGSYALSNKTVIKIFAKGCFLDMGNLLIDRSFIISLKQFAFSPHNMTSQKYFNKYH